MSKRLKIRLLKLNNLPYGKYTWAVTLVHTKNNISRCLSNGTDIQPLKELLTDSAIGNWRLIYQKNYKKNRIYTKIYLTHKIDVALLKLCYTDKLRKIYRIELKINPILLVSELVHTHDIISN